MWPIAPIVILFIIIVAASGEDSYTTPEVTQDTIAPIEYSVLREWNPNDDSSSIGLEILNNQQDVSKNNIITD